MNKRAFDKLVRQRERGWENQTRRNESLSGV